MGDAANGTRYVAPAEGTLPGVHLLEKDVVKLQKIAKRYGAFLARSDVFAVIDVPAGPSWPGDRWIWASNEVYLELPPPTLEALSFEVIRPRVARYRVRLTNGDACSAAGLSDAAVRGQVYEELAKILTPSGQPYLKGQLVRVRKRNALLDRPRLDAYAYADGAYASADFSRTVMRGRGWHAFYASIALAFFATLYALVVGSRYLSAMQTLADQSSKIQMRLTKTSAKNVAAAARDDDEDDAEDGKAGAFKEAADDADAAAQREEQAEASALAKEAEAAEAELKQLGDAADAVVADDEEGDGGDLQDWGGISPTRTRTSTRSSTPTSSTARGRGSSGRSSTRASSGRAWGRASSTRPSRARRCCSRAPSSSSSSSSRRGPRGRRSRRVSRACWCCPRASRCAGSGRRRPRSCPRPS